MKHRGGRSARTTKEFKDLDLGLSQTEVKG